MAKRRIVYRDYRPGREGKFVSKHSFDRAKKGNIRREYVKRHDVESLYDLQDYEDYDGEPQEYHGTGDTGE